MTKRLFWLVVRLGRRLWFRAGLFAVLGVASALLSAWIAPVVPADFSARIGADAVDKVLAIIASSMLTVSIFSLSTMVAAYGSAASAATPRATQLIQQDSGALNALGTFIGAFLFSFVGIIALSTGIYGSSGRVVLFVVTIGVVAAVVMTFIGWIDQLSRLGRMGETIDRVAEAAAAAIIARRIEPSLGGVAARRLPSGFFPVAADRTGYIQHIDLEALNAAIPGEIDVVASPGGFISGTGILVLTQTRPDEKTEKAIRNAFLIAARRSFDQDPRFGVIVLSEIASRALSPAVNDPGTAIDVLAALTRVLADGRDHDEKPARYPRIHLPVIEAEALLEDCITPIARDGAGLIEVGLRLQRTLRIMAEWPDYAGPARRQAQDALERGLATLVSETDRARLRRQASWLES